ncbi:MAG: tol-pal system-associated acyl-CoA thioesterase [Gammaproteobacteria bacterium]|nr:tol-pal system-associated acyl-CoA thioesterase [Gammaproteobacteria bacterium]MDE2345948.1 tol-pal system-associated acyl-CoA thioesterase [Gammaproteobacteria bacterium]
MPGHGGSAAEVSGTFTWPVRVYYEDTDFGGVVYHANYLKFLERGRSEWLRHLGFEQDKLREQLGIQFVVVGMQLEFHQPALFNHELEVSVLVTGMRPASMIFDQSITDLTAGRALVCSAQVRAACVDSVTHKPKPLPREIVAELA